MSKKTPHILTALAYLLGNKLTVLFESTLIRYLFVGGGAYVIEMISLFVLKYICGLSSIHAIAISFWIGFIVAFMLQKIVAFKDYSRGARILSRQLLGYSALVAFNYGFTLLVAHIFADRINVFIIRTATIATVTLWNYFIYSRLFGDSSDGKS